jgi:hypothetical protein
MARRERTSNVDANTVDVNIVATPASFIYTAPPATVTTTSHVGPMAQEMALAEEALRKAHLARKRKPVDPVSDLRFFRLHTSGGGTMSYGEIAANDSIALERKMTRRNVIDAVKRGQKQAKT